MSIYLLSMVNNDDSADEVRGGSVDGVTIPSTHRLAIQHFIKLGSDMQLPVTSTEVEMLYGE